MLIAGRPVVVIEDLHWADPETLDVVESSPITSGAAAPRWW